MAVLHASKPVFRFVILILNCLLTFGSYFCFDMPSVLQERFQCNSSQVNQTGDGTHHECLDMSPANYNLLYAVYAWTNAVIVIGAGFFIDKVGNQVGAFAFSSLTVLGSILFAAGTLLKGTSAMLPIMLLGRLLFGAGNGSLTIVQSRLSAFWFKDKELAMAFGATLAFSRLGSVLNFLVTVHFADRFGIQWTLWGGAILCGTGFLAAITVGILDKVGLKQLGLDQVGSENSKKLRFTDIKDFNILYWLIAFTIMFFYNGVFPFVADASKFIHDKYGFPQDQAAYMAGAVYYLSMVLSPGLGFLIDYIGKRGYLSLACAVLTTPVFGLLALTHLYPLIFTLWLGFTYSVAAASMWPSIPLVIKQSAIGTAMGLTTSLQMIGIGISNLCVGAILGPGDQSHEATLDRWKYVMLFLLGNNILCIVTASLLNIFDRTRNKVLNLSKSQKESIKTFEASNGSIQQPDDEPSETEPLLGNRIPEA